MEKSLSQKYSEIQIQRYLIKTGQNPVELIAIMMDESRIKEQMEIAIDMTDSLKGVQRIKGLSERSIYRRLDKYKIFKRPEETSKIIHQNKKT